MRFHKLTLSGFLSYSDKKQSVSLKKRGLVLVRGENRDDATTSNNGGGKSTLLEAILWCLYGKTLRGLAPDKVVNLRSKRGCMVRLSFSDDKGQIFTVTRYRKHKKHKNALVFEGPGITANEAARTQESIEDTLGLTYQAFVSAVIFGQGNFKRFAEMTDGEKKGITDRLIGLETLALARKQVVEKLRDLEEALDDLELRDIKELKADLKDAKRDKRAWDERQQQKLVELKKLLKGAKAPDMEELAKALDRAAKDHGAAITAWDKEVRAVAVARDALSEVKAKQSSLADALKSVNKDAGQCGHCGSVVTKESLTSHRNAILKEMEKLKASVEEAEHELATAETSQKSARATVNSADAVRSAAQTRLADGKSTVSLIAQNEKMCATLESERNPHKKAIERARTKLHEAGQHNAEVTKKRKALEGQHKRLLFVSSMFSDKGSANAPPLKSLLMESVAPYLNKRLAHYTRLLTDGNIDVRFNTQRELKNGELRDDYELEVTNAFGSDTYQGASNGEKRKIDVIVFLALQDLVARRSKGRVAFFVFDEVFDALDEVAQEVMVGLLQSEVAKKETVLVITQRPELEGHFPNAITVVKRHGNSRIK